MFYLLNMHPFTFAHWHWHLFYRLCVQLCNDPELDVFFLILFVKSHLYLFFYFFFYMFASFVPSLFTVF